MDGASRNEFFALCEAQPDLLSLPGLLFAGNGRLNDARRHLSACAMSNAS